MRLEKAGLDTGVYLSCFLLVICTIAQKSISIRDSDVGEAERAEAMSDIFEKGEECYMGKWQQVRRLT